MLWRVDNLRRCVGGTEISGVDLDDFSFSKRVFYVWRFCLVDFVESLSCWKSVVDELLLEVRIVIGIVLCR